MTAITTEIQAFHDDKLSFDELVADLAKAAYAAPEGIAEAPLGWDGYNSVEDRYPMVENGTFQEVTAAWAQGLLTDEQYLAINQAVADYHAAKKAVSDMLDEKQG